MKQALEKLECAEKKFREQVNQVEKDLHLKQRKRRKQEKNQKVKKFVPSSMEK
jgi:hypothetical protein